MTKDEIKDLLYKAHRANAPRLFMSILASYNKQKDVPAYAADAIDDMEIRHRFIKRYWDSLEIRALMKKITLDVNPKDSIRIKRAWSSMPIADFNLRGANVTRWLVTAGLHNSRNDKPVAIKMSVQLPETTEEMVDWYLDMIDV